MWDKLIFSASLTLKDFTTLLEDKHRLQLVSWDFIYGHKLVYDEELKKKVSQCVSTPVYPPKPVLDYSLLPPLDLTTAQVTTFTGDFDPFLLWMLARPGYLSSDEDQQGQADAAVLVALERMQG